MFHSSGYSVSFQHRDTETQRRSFRLIARQAVSLCLCVSVLTLSVVRAASSTSCAHSSLWGVAGERWEPAGRLPDFSYAGYRACEAEIPAPPARWNLKRDFGAKGDGRTDDSQALLNAVRSIKGGVLFIPKGTYVIARRIDINRGNLILRGAGPNETILYFPNSLTDLFGNTFNEAKQSQWSFRPGLVNVTGSDPITAETRLASVTAPARRGDKVLKLSAPISVKRGSGFVWSRATRRRARRARGRSYATCTERSCRPGRGSSGLRTWCASYRG